MNIETTLEERNSKIAVTKKLLELRATLSDAQLSYFDEIVNEAVRLCSCGNFVEHDTSSQIFGLGLCDSCVKWYVIIFRGSKIGVTTGCFPAQPTIEIVERYVNATLQTVTLISCNDEKEMLDKLQEIKTEYADFFVPSN